jgi:predicted Zn-dependent protease
VDTAFNSTPGAATKCGARPSSAATMPTSKRSTSRPAPSRLRSTSSAGTTIDEGVGLRVVCGEAVGYAVTERFDRNALLATARRQAGLPPDEGVPFARRFPSWSRLVI